MEAKWMIVLFYLAVVNAELLRKQYHNPMFSMPDLRGICEQYRNVKEVEEKCARELKIVCGNLTLLVMMMDASSKFPFTGLGFSDRTDYGNFDQCLSIKHEYRHGSIVGEHCAEGLHIPDFLGDPSDVHSYYKLSVCRPSACKSRDYNAIMVKLINPKYPQVFNDDNCRTLKHETLNIIDIVTLTIFGITIWLIIISTAYDTYIRLNQLKCHHPLFITFSVISNGKKLIHTSDDSDSREHIHTFHGLRAISMMWIVAGHAMMIFERVAVTNKAVWADWADLPYAGYITAAPISVDTFFFMSGFLVSFHYLKYKKEASIKNQILSVPRMYIHRYLRLTPALLMIFLVAISLINHLGSGPLWNIAEENSENCKKYWWTTFLYIQNYYNHEELCLRPTWYLSADMQLFFISPLVLIPLTITLRKSGYRKVMRNMFILNMFCSITPILVKFFYPDYNNIYNTHSRLIGYFSGMMFGVFMRETIETPFLYMVKQKYRSAVNLVMWVVIILCMASLIIGLPIVNVHCNRKGRMIYYSLMRPAWCVFLSWIVYSCYHGHGGCVNWILCRPIFQILGRLTYCTFLVHQSVIDYYLSTAKTSWYFNDYNAIIRVYFLPAMNLLFLSLHEIMRRDNIHLSQARIYTRFYAYCGTYTVTIIIATFWTLAFESPLIVMEKYLTRNSIEFKPTVYLNGDTDKILGRDVIKPENHKDAENATKSGDAFISNCEL